MGLGSLTPISTMWRHQRTASRLLFVRQGRLSCGCSGFAFGFLFHGGVRERPLCERHVGGRTGRSGGGGSGWTGGGCPHGLAWTAAAAVAGTAAAAAGAAAAFAGQRWTGCRGGCGGMLWLGLSPACGEGLRGWASADAQGLGLSGCAGVLWRRMRLGWADAAGCCGLGLRLPRMRAGDGLWLGRGGLGLGCCCGGGGALGQRTMRTAPPISRDPRHQTPRRSACCRIQHMSDLHVPANGRATWQRRGRSPPILSRARLNCCCG